MSDDSFDFFRSRRINFLDSSDEDQSLLPSNRTIERYLGPPICDTLPVVNYVYIDDYNAIEQVYIRNSKSHITNHTRKIQAHAHKSDELFHNVQELASEIKMRVKEDASPLHSTFST